MLSSSFYLNDLRKHSSRLTHFEFYSWIISHFLTQDSSSQPNVGDQFKMLLTRFIITGLNVPTIYLLCHYDVALLSFVFQASTVLLKVNFDPALQVIWAFMPLSRIHSFNKFFFLRNNGVPGCSRCPEYNTVVINSKTPFFKELILEQRHTTNNN